ncbi:MAG: type IV pilin-like G/H family protein [Leptolyngbyaceae cyanobacterium]
MTDSPGNNESPEVSSESSSSGSNTTKVILIVAGVGCGCLALPIIGIIAAIALPSFLNQADRARESEAKVFLGTMTRGQQAYYLEQEEFASSIEALEVGLSDDSPSYSYAVVPQPDPTSSVYITATPKESSLSGMSAAVFATEDGSTTPIICESDSPTPPALPSFDATSGEATCPPGSSQP